MVPNDSLDKVNQHFQKMKISGDAMQVDRDIIVCTTNELQYDYVDPNRPTFPRFKVGNTVIKRGEWVLRKYKYIIQGSIESMMDKDNSDEDLYEAIECSIANFCYDVGINAPDCCKSVATDENDDNDNTGNASVDDNDDNSEYLPSSSNNNNNNEIETKANDPMDNINQQMQKMTVNDDMEIDKFRPRYTLTDFETWEDIEIHCQFVCYAVSRSIVSVREKLTKVSRRQCLPLLWTVCVLKKFLLWNDLSFPEDLVRRKTFYIWKAEQKRKCIDAGGFDQWWAQVHKRFGRMDPLFAKIFKICVTKEIESSMKK